ncbi:MAG: hypothetical protein ACI4GW_04400 [Lachnospiraceae bacterium]
MEKRTFRFDGENFVKSFFQDGKGAVPLYHYTCEMHGTYYFDINDLFAILHKSCIMKLYADGKGIGDWIHIT